MAATPDTQADDGVRRGRRRGQSDTKERILESGRCLFATLGYEGTSIRGVAEKAGVDPALVMHYFGSKEGLFQAAIDWPFDMDDAARQIFEGAPELIGERLVRMVCAVWEDQTTRHPLTVIVRNAVQREDAARLMSEFVARQMVARVVERTKDPADALRAALAHSALVGMVITRYLIGVEPLASVPAEEVVKAVGPAIQRYLAGVMGSSASRSG